MGDFVVGEVTADPFVSSRNSVYLQASACACMMLNNIVAMQVVASCFLLRTDVQTRARRCKLESFAMTILLRP